MDAKTPTDQAAKERRAEGYRHPEAGAPFRAGVRGQAAVRAVDDRGNELMVVKPLSEAETGA